MLNPRCARTDGHGGCEGRTRHVAAKKNVNDNATQVDKRSWFWSNAHVHESTSPSSGPRHAIPLRQLDTGVSDPLSHQGFVVRDDHPSRYCSKGVAPSEPIAIADPRWRFDARLFP